MRKREPVAPESKEYDIDPEKIITRKKTSVMIKNIPNKYSQSMLMELFDV
jgi:hypothetical protein